MRAALPVLALAAALGAAALAPGGARADDPAPASGEPAPASGDPAPGAPVHAGRADATMVFGFDPDLLPVEHDELRGTRRPSGFWTGYRPARGGAYRWRMLAIALAVVGLTAFLVIRALRRAAATARTT